MGTSPLLKASLTNTGLFKAGAQAPHRPSNSPPRYERKTQSDTAASPRTPNTTVLAGPKIKEMVEVASVDSKDDEEYGDEEEEDKDNDDDDDDEEEEEEEEEEVHLDVTRLAALSPDIIKKPMGTSDDGHIGAAKSEKKRNHLDETPIGGGRSTSPHFFFAAAVVAKKKKVESTSLSSDHHDAEGETETRRLSFGTQRMQATGEHKTSNPLNDEKGEDDGDIYDDDDDDDDDNDDINIDKFKKLQELGTSLLSKTLKVQVESVVVDDRGAQDDYGQGERDDTMTDEDLHGMDNGPLQKGASSDDVGDRSGGVGTNGGGDNVDAKDEDEDDIRKSNNDDAEMVANNNEDKEEDDDDENNDRGQDESSDFNDLMVAAGDVDEYDDDDEVDQDDDEVSAEEAKYGGVSEKERMALKRHRCEDQEKTYLLLAPSDQLDDDGDAQDDDDQDDDDQVDNDDDDSDDNDDQDDGKVLPLKIDGKKEEAPTRRTKMPRHSYVSPSSSTTTSSSQAPPSTAVEMRAPLAVATTASMSPFSCVVS